MKAAVILFRPKYLLFIKFLTVYFSFSVCSSLRAFTCIYIYRLVQSKSSNPLKVL